jgi:hypothetical protein
MAPRSCRPRRGVRLIADLCGRPPDTFEERRSGNAVPCARLEARMNALSAMLLVVATAVMGLGIPTVTASLPSGAGANPGALDRRPIGRDVSLEPDAAQIDAEGARWRTWKSPSTLGGIATPAELPHGGARPWASPLYPQNGVTVWDVIRVSSQRDHRAFLLGTAIQVHAPAMAATPGPQRTFLGTCPCPVGARSDASPKQ